MLSSNSTRFIACLMSLIMFCSVIEKRSAFLAKYYNRPLRSLHMSDSYFSAYNPEDKPAPSRGGKWMGNSAKKTFKPRSEDNRNYGQKRDSNSNDSRFRSPSSSTSFTSSFSSYASRDSSDRRSYSRDDNRDRSRPTYSNNNNNNYNNAASAGPMPAWKLAKEEKGDPIYGYYNGDHIYGINPVLLALKAGVRQMDELIVQQDLDYTANKKDSVAVKMIFKLVEALGIPKREFSKHDLHMLSENRPHQGFILRAQPLEYSELAHGLEPSSKYKVVLALDEVSDPQNFGALLRSAYFLGCSAVIIFAKNSAPMSPTVSKASAGAMEVMAGKGTIYSVKNMMRCLDASKENGWQVIGTELSRSAVPLSQIPHDKPTILVLGNEGHGMRTNIVKRCDHLVKIDRGGMISNDISSDTCDDVDEVAEEAAEGGGGEGVNDDSIDALIQGANSYTAVDGNNQHDVDSLNVSVTGGILLHHFLTASK